MENTNISRIVNGKFSITPETKFIEIKGRIASIEMAEHGQFCMVNDLSPTPYLSCEDTIRVASHILVEDRGEELTWIAVGVKFDDLVTNFLEMDIADNEAEALATRNNAISCLEEALKRLKEAPLLVDRNCRS